MWFYILHRYIENPSINSLVTERCGWINLDLCTLGWSGSQASHKSSTSEGLPENFWFYLDSPRAALFGPIQLQVADIRKKQGKNRNIRSNACKIVFWTKVHITVSLARIESKVRPWQVLRLPNFQEQVGWGNWLGRGHTLVKSIMWGGASKPCPPSVLWLFCLAMTIRVL